MIYGIKKRPEYGNSDIVYEIDEENKRIKILLSLINKQQKEIEEQRKELVNLTHSLIFDHISKDKIRKYLKQLELEDKERMDYAAKELGINGLFPDITYFKIKKELEKMLDEKLLQAEEKI